MSGIDAIGPCAGPGGWGVAARRLGIVEAGIELDARACATRAAAGLLTVRADVAALDPRPMRGIRGLIFSPPCGPFSMAGLQKGIGDIALVLGALDDLARGRDTRDRLAKDCRDPRTPLVVEPLRYALAMEPEWIALEQVPTVLPIWKFIAGLLGCLGYSVWTGVLDAADFDMGQTRRRAFLAASRVRAVAAPVPADGCRPLPMAKVLGWGYTRRPSPTVTGGGVATGGAEPFGNAARRAMREASADPAQWIPNPRGGVRIDSAEAARLQGFPDGYPFQGNKGQVALQVGNAVPPPLAEAVLRAATGR